MNKIITFICHFLNIFFFSFFTHSSLTKSVSYDKYRFFFSIFLSGILDTTEWRSVSKGKETEKAPTQVGGGGGTTGGWPSRFSYPIIPVLALILLAPASLRIFFNCEILRNVTYTSCPLFSRARPPRPPSTNRGKKRKPTNKQTGGGLGSYYLRHKAEEEHYYRDNVICQAKFESSTEWTDWNRS